MAEALSTLLNELKSASPSIATIKSLQKHITSSSSSSLPLLREVLRRTAQLACTQDRATSLTALALAQCAYSQLTSSENERKGVGFQTFAAQVRAAVLASALCHAQAHPWTSPESRQLARALLGALARGTMEKLDGGETERELDVDISEDGSRANETERSRQSNAAVEDETAEPKRLSGNENDRRRITVTKRVADGGAALDADALPYVLDILDARRWEDRPVMWAAVSSAVLRVRHPHMGPHVSLLLPLLLQWLEQHRVPLRLIALRTTTHVVQQVNSPDLTATGVDRVLLSAVDRLLFVPEAEVVALALPCAASLLRAMNHNPARRASPAHDELMAKLLKFIRWEDKLAKRRAYMDGLRPLIQACGLSICTHLQTLMPVLEAYCTCADVETRELALLALAETIRQAKPRMLLPQRQQWLRALLKRASLKEGLVLDKGADLDGKAATPLNSKSDSDDDDGADDLQPVPARATPLIGQGTIEPRLQRAAELCHDALATQM